MIVQFSSSKWKNKQKNAAAQVLENLALFFLKLLALSQKTDWIQWVIFHELYAACNFCINCNTVSASIYAN